VIRPQISARKLIEARHDLETRWLQWRDRHAPRLDGIWAYSAEIEAHRGLAGAGWKIHLSATTLNAPDLLERCEAPLLRSGFPFKIAKSLDEVVKLNAAIESPRSQVGKLVTIYSFDPAQARRLAEDLHDRLRGFPGPEVPSDLRFRSGSNVFYRYGAYEEAEVEVEGRTVPAYHDSSGNLVPDRRTRATAAPAGLVNPFVDPAPTAEVPSKPGTPAKYTAYGVIYWRGSGGVYHARENASGATVPRVLKEGLRHSEVFFDGSDGFSRRRVEKRTLGFLRRAGIPVPAVVDFFTQDEAAYLVLEKIEGATLSELIERGGADLATALQIGLQLAGILVAMHAAGWAWGDCKPGNLIYDGQRLWAIDMETAFRIKGRPRGFYATEGYFAKRTEVVTGPGAVAHDLYALGVTLHRLLTHAGELQVPKVPDLPELPQELDPSLRRLIAELKSDDARRRPSAKAAQAAFDAALASSPSRLST
jgi:Protein kinase domain